MSNPVLPTSPRKIDLTHGKRKSLKKKFKREDKALKKSGEVLRKPKKESKRKKGKEKEKEYDRDDKGKEKVTHYDEWSHRAAKDNVAKRNLDGSDLYDPSVPPPPPPPPTPASINTIPEELLIHVMSFLPHFPTLISSSAVCKKWHTLITRPELWNEVYLGRYEKIASDRLVVWIATLNPQLQTLSLKGCTQVTDVGLTAALGRCSNLRGLYLEDLERQFSVRCLLMIGKLCPHLDTLVLPSILENTDEVLQLIVGCCSNLRVFKSFSQFSEATFKCLAETCTKLEKLRFGTTTKSTILSQNAVKYITKLSNLKSLECGYFSMGEVDWGRKPLTNFKSFRAFGWLDISPGALRAMLKNTPNLETLHLIHSGGEDEVVMNSFKLEYISQYCPRLANVNLCDTPFCENDVTTIVRECRELKELRVGMKSNPGTDYELTDSWIYQVINFSPKIEVLQIYHASLRANTVPMITRGCKNLRSLTLGKCSEVKELTSHLETLTTLERLSLRNTPVRDSALQVMMTAFPYLQTLTLIETGVSNAMIGFVIGRYRLQSIKLQPRSRLTVEGKILYRGRSRGRLVKLQALTPQENIFLEIFKTQLTATEAMVKKGSETKRNYYTNN